MVYCSYRAAPPLVVPKTFGLYPNVSGVANWTRGYGTPSGGIDGYSSSGCFKVTVGGTSQTQAIKGTGDVRVEFKASNSSSVYGKSNGVKVASAQFLMIIKA